MNKINFIIISLIFYFSCSSKVFSQLIRNVKVQRVVENSIIDSLLDLNVVKLQMRSDFLIEIKEGHGVYLLSVIALNKNEECLNLNNRDLSNNPRFFSYKSHRIFVLGNEKSHLFFLKTDKNLNFCFKTNSSLHKSSFSNHSLNSEMLLDMYELKYNRFFSVVDIMH